LFSLILPTVPMYVAPFDFHFWFPEGCTPSTLFCGRRRRAETRHAWEAATLQQGVLHDDDTESLEKVEKLCW